MSLKDQCSRTQNSNKYLLVILRTTPIKIVFDSQVYELRFEQEFNMIKIRKTPFHSLFLLLYSSFRVGRSFFKALLVYYTSRVSKTSTIMKKVCNVLETLNGKFFSISRPSCLDVFFIAFIHKK